MAYRPDPLSWDAVVPRANRAAAARLDRGWQAWSANADAVLAEMEVIGRAQTAVENRYFGGRSVLVGDVADEWAAARALADRLGWLSVLPPAVRSRARRRKASGTGTPALPVRQQVNRRVAELTDDARIAAFGLLGERAPAVAIVQRRLWSI